jgi:outer membrane protein TolC
MRILPFLVVLATATAAHGAGLSLDEALKLAEGRSLQLAAQRAAVEAARAVVPSARENPDPKLVAAIENVPVEGGDRWSLNADFMTMRRVGVMQDFVRREKRELRESRAAAEADREAAVLEMQRADLRREVATAWLERHYAERAQDVLDTLRRETEAQAELAATDVAGGRTSVAEAIAVRALRATVADRRQESEQKARRATALLARWLGADAIRPLGAPPDIRVLPAHHAGALEADLEAHPHLAMLAPMEAAAVAEMRLAAAATKPDWSLELSYAQRGSAYSNMVSLMFRMELPLFASRRQDLVTSQKAKLLEQVRAQAEDARARHLAEIRSGIVDWEIAHARLERNEREIVPAAEERARMALAAYEGARSDLAAVLEARRARIEARLTALSVELELARAWAQLAFLLPERRQP